MYAYLGLRGGLPRLQAGDLAHVTDRIAVPQDFGSAMSEMALHDLPHDAVLVEQPSLPTLVKSTARVLQIFDFFDEVQRPARVNEIAELLNVPQSLSSVLLKSLIKLGFI